MDANLLNAQRSFIFAHEAQSVLGHERVRCHLGTFPPPDLVVGVDPRWLHCITRDSTWKCWRSQPSQFPSDSIASVSEPAPLKIAHQQSRYNGQHQLQISPGVDIDGKQRVLSPISLVTGTEVCM